MASIIHTLLDKAVETCAIGTFVFAIYLQSGLFLVCVIRFAVCGFGDAFAQALATLLAMLTFTPLEWTTGSFSRKFIKHACKKAADYLPAKVILEEGSSLKPDQAYVVGFEPHSALPVAMPIVFATESDLLPPELRNRCHGLASSVCFKVPIVRQLWWWLGIRPVDKLTIRTLLNQNKAVVLIPGGVQECLYMQQGEELVFLKSRTGFVRLALEQGAHIIPVFALGQSKALTWFRPGPPLISQTLLEWLSRQVGCVPLWMHGAYFSPLPHRTPVNVVIGKPIEVPRIVAPTDADVQIYLQQFVDSIVKLFEKHKAECGCSSMKLKVM